MAKYTIRAPEAILDVLERERRRLDTVQETIRSILEEYFRVQGFRLCGRLGLICTVPHLGFQDV